MAIDQTKAKEYASKLLTCRMRLLASHSFYGLLLAHTKFALDEKCQTAYTDGKRIAFSPEFLESLSDEETEFVLMHEILHIALKHCLRGHDYNQEAFNIACDIVVNSNILKSFGDNYRRISIGGEPLMHLAPNGNPSHMYTAEELYDMLPKSMKVKQSKSQSSSSNGNNRSEKKPGDQSGGSDKGQKDGKKGEYGSAVEQGQLIDKAKGKSGYFVFDDHSFWTNDENIQDIDAWDKHFEDACKIVSIEDPSNTWGSLPAFAERILKLRQKAQTNWREVLDNFVQDDINDYSFNPPDRRFSDSDFMLPDLNEPTETVKNVLFMIDTSGSMSDDMIAQAFQEIRGAIGQFGGRLEGYLGFFDAVVVPPVPFSTVEELDIIRLYGGGGTRFDIIFDYVKKEMKDNPPSSIVILTDGYAPFPLERTAHGIPVLWVINNDDVVPPWGKHTVITV